MGATTQKSLFDQVYQVFGKDAESRMLLDWDNYVKNINGKLYYVWTELTPLVSTNRIPYWTWNKQFYDNSSYDGYLPEMSGFYFSMRPISWFGFTSQADKLKSRLVNNRSKLGSLTEIQINDIDIRTAATVYFFDAKTGKYRCVIVPITGSFFKVRYFCFAADDTENVRENYLLWNKAVRDCAKELANTYNWAVTLQASSNFTKLKPVYQQQIIEAQKDASAKINNLLRDPYVYGKTCAECAKNAQLGVIPLVVLIVALALAAFTVTAVVISNNITKLDTQRIQAQRATDALKQLRDVLSDKSLSAADKEKYFTAAGSVVDNANQNSSNVTEPGNGFFDKIENLLFLAGGFLILNNVTKKS